MKMIATFLFLLATFSLAACTQRESGISANKVNQTTTFAKVNSGALEFFNDAQNGVNCYIYTDQLSSKASRMSCTLSSTKISGGMSRNFPFHTNEGTVQRVKYQRTHDICYIYTNDSSYSGSGMSCLPLNR